MYIELTPEQRQLQAELREYFSNLISPEEAKEMKADRHGKAYRAVIKRMGSDGKLGVGWPKEFGGLGYGPIEQSIFVNEAHRADVPLPAVTLQTVGPTLQVYGSEAQKKKFLPAILAGEVHFAIGYTEPEAGTDLASLRTTAVRHGDEYIVNGQKVFTTGGHDADYVWLACRTDPEAAKHKGISILIVDTTDPGYSWTPMILSDGAHHTNATYYNDVRVGGEPQRKVCPRRARLLGRERMTGAAAQRLVLHRQDHGHAGLVRLGDRGRDRVEVRRHVGRDRVGQRGLRHLQPHGVGVPPAGQRVHLRLTQVGRRCGRLLVRAAGSGERADQAEAASDGASETDHEHVDGVLPRRGLRIAGGRQEDDRRLGDPHAVTTGVGIDSFAISADQRHIVYAKTVERSNIWSTSLGGDADAMWSAARPLAAENQTLESLELSADGRWIVFDSTRRGSSDLWRVNVDGTGLTQITNDAGDEWHPSLSPDGRTVAYHAALNGNREIFTASVGGGERRQLTNHPAKDWLPRWSPDGRSIAFVSDRNGSQDIFLVPSEGGASRALVSDPANDHNPLWALDGRAIYFASNRDGGDELFVIAREGGTPERITYENWDDVVPLSASADGCCVYVWARGQDEPLGFWTVRLDTGSAEPLLRGGFASHQLGVSAATDGRHLFFPVWERSANLWRGELSLGR
jgi:hypothetical protein